MIDLNLLPNETAALVWPRVQHFAGLDRALEEGYLAEDLTHKFAEGQLQLWSIADGDTLLAICITSIEIFPRTKICNIHAICGKAMTRWIGLIAEIEIWARDNDCTQVQIFGRKGWERMLPQYDNAKVVLVKKLHDA